MTTPLPIANIRHALFVGWVANHLHAHVEGETARIVIPLTSTRSAYISISVDIPEPPPEWDDYDR